MRTQKFGIEIEMTGITRAAAAQVIADHFNTSATHVGGIFSSPVFFDASILSQFLYLV